MPRVGLVPYWQTTDGSQRLYHGDVVSVLRRMPANSVQMVVTSPPYWGLRDYKVTGQIGSEKTPGEFVDKMVEVFWEVRRVLRDDGTVWLNLGDSYGGVPPGGFTKKQHSNIGSYGATKGNGGLVSGNLVGMPWRVALALQAAGWILRQDIIWAKPGPMPESVTNRCTKSHEYIFLLAKSARYYYDAVAIKEKSDRAGVKLSGDYSVKKITDDKVSGGWIRAHGDTVANFRNKRSVWRVSSQGYEGAHFACFPPKLITPCILAGTSEHGCCAECGTPWKRVVEETKLTRERPNDYVKRTGEEGTGNSCANSVAGVDVKTLGWEPGCTCEAEVQPCIVLDPFIGSGTALEVCVQHGRHGWGIDLSEQYLRDNAVPRVEGALLSRSDMAHLTGRKAEAVELGADLLLG